MKFTKYCILIIFYVASLSTAKGTNIVYSKSDSLIYEAYIEKFAKQNNQPYGQLLVNTAKYFLGKPYVGATLETTDKETLIINLRELDCTTFVENCIALSQVIKSKNYSFANYCKTLVNIRYRNGHIAGYNSRLHYTSDWIYENEKKGLLENISIRVGGKEVQKTINYMTTHPESYKHLKENTENLEKAKEIENSLNKRNCYSFLPVTDILKNQKNIIDGDIVVFATSLSGMDYSHIGIAYWQNSRLHFIHASSKQKQVVIETKTLLDYCHSSKSCTGISILRINN